MTTRKHSGNNGGPKPPDVSYRSAVSGRFVKEQYAKTHPDTTVKERNKK